MLSRAATPRGKHIPLRTCLGCRTAKPKRELVRIVGTAEGRVAVDLTGKAQGRGAYLCPHAGCAQQALKASTLSRALRLTLDETALTELREWAGRLTNTAGTPAP